MDAILKLQKFNPEKLVELCRMHLTFTLDLHDDEFSALIEKCDEKKKPRGYFSRFLKEKSITEVMPLNQETISHIYQIIEYLGREINICREGLFRKTGSLARQNELKTLLRIGENIDFNSGLYTVHDCASVLKSFLSELQEPLLSEAHYSAHCQIADMMKDNMLPSQKQNIFERQLKATKLLLLLLPVDNYCLLKYLLLLLNQIQNCQEQNKMTSENLATLFAPHIICPRKMTPEMLKQSFPRMAKCITFLIDNATSLFEPPKELVQDVLIYLKEMKYEGILQSSDKVSPVKTLVTFCERTNMEVAEPANYTNKALAELYAYVESLPNSSKKRKLIKKLQEENKEVSTEKVKKHVRSRSVGNAIKRHLLKNSHKKKDELDYRHSAYDMALSVSKSIETTSFKSKSYDALDLEVKEPSRFAEIKKSILRSSRKKVPKLEKPDG
ncbi:rho GTPase-activating protein 19-like [Argiope bruennichi]|uniref:rho GTPase-activating protein 19-like n=1 Tax=Argiope bruennichi TaxID=94029 RepID=UPI002494CBA6|nr:rho GTPase-activating protein 19-like [Argiope bruennichi]XP_055936567.1 rho GTPase-activating protein 19-like [Argiope bruennichi]